MHSQRAAAPVLVLPRARLNLLPTQGPVQAKPLCPLDAKRRKELENLADYLERMTEDWGTGFSYFRAASDLRDHARQTEAPVPATHSWLWQPRALKAAPLAATRNPYFNTMPEMAWNMMVQFSRRDGAHYG